MKAARRRQLLLFPIALILPSLAVVGFGLMTMRQERELGEKRAEEARRQTVAAVRHDILDRLNAVKLRETSAHLDIDSVSTAPLNASVVLIAWEEQGRLALPWDRDRSAAKFLLDTGDSNHTRKIEAAEMNPDQAIALYDAALGEAANPHQSADARWRLGKALQNAGRRGDAVRHYRALLELPVNAVNGQGMPFAYLAADRLLGAGAEQDVLRRLSREVEVAPSLSPLQTASLQYVVDKLPKPPDSLAAGLRRRQATIDQAIKLQREFESQRLAPSTWRVFGPDPWFVGISDARPDNRRLVVAVRMSDVIREVESQHAGVSIRPVSGGNREEMFGESLPGLGMSFASPGPEASGGQGSPQGFYLLSIVLVVGLTIVGGYLVWRDTRRELQLAELRSQFVSNVSHELKTPLTSIRMFAEALRMKGLADAQRFDEYLDTIVNESERLTRLLNNVLDFSRIETGKRSYRTSPVDLAGIVADAARTMKYPLARQGFDLRLDVPPEAPFVHGDGDAIKQAILNLLANAIKYSGSSREIGLRLARQNGSAVIQVWDRGVGIAREDHSRIFERFYRVSSPENQSIAGAGLGLTLVSHIAAAHGGVVGVESAPGKGSTFSITLPLSPAGSVTPIEGHAR
jgi:two-component sensor histidine kinase